MKLHWSVKRGGIIVKTYKEHLLTSICIYINKMSTVGFWFCFCISVTFCGSVLYRWWVYQYAIPAITKSGTNPQTTLPRPNNVPGVSAPPPIRSGASSFKKKKSSLFITKVFTLAQHILPMKVTLRLQTFQCQWQCHLHDSHGKSVIESLLFSFIFYHLTASGLMVFSALSKVL